MSKTEKDEPQPWQVLRSESVLENRWAKVQRDVCRLQDGKIIDDYYYWVGGDYAQTVATTTDGKVLLVEQYKHGVKEIVLELPGGLIDASDDLPLVAAQRELLEETGHAAGDWSPLICLNVSSAKATTKAHVFLASNAIRISDPELDCNERIKVVSASFEELMGLIREGRIRDASSVAGCLLAYCDRLKR